MRKIIRRTSLDDSDSIDDFNIVFRTKKALAFQIHEVQKRQGASMDRHPPHADEITIHQ